MKFLAYRVLDMNRHPGALVCRVYTAMEHDAARESDQVVKGTITVFEAANLRVAWGQAESLLCPA